MFNHRSGIRLLERRTVHVTLLTGESLRGVVVGDYDDSVALAHVTHLDEKADLAGELVIPKGRINYFQTGVDVPEGDA